MNEREKSSFRLGERDVLLITETSVSDLNEQRSQALETRCKFNYRVRERLEE